MTIATLLLWMAMQGRNLVPDANGNITAQSVTFAPAEHVIEIKARRAEPPTFIAAWNEHCPKNFDLNFGTLAPGGVPVCNLVVREIWIDGVKWGVLKGD